MGIFGMVRDLWNGGADDRDDYYDDEEEYEEPEVMERPRKEQPRLKYDRDSKVVSIHTTAQLQVVIVRPERFDEVAEIADQLIDKNTVVLNLEQTGKDVSRRVVDFLSGAAYAHNGQLKRIANNTYIITPFNVGLTGADVLGELENNGVFF
ncbi:MAG: cell division protein SepF [Ruminococcaceae bacterium]|nr:cell division protein SepF [Oscillospiraceae bacterium]